MLKPTKHPPISGIWIRERGSHGPLDGVMKMHAVDLTKHYEVLVRVHRSSSTSKKDQWRLVDLVLR